MSKLYADIELYKDNLRKQKMQGIRETNPKFIALQDKITEHRRNLYGIIEIIVEYNMMEEIRRYGER